MLGDNVQKVVDNFGKGLVKQSRANLTRKGKRNTNGLYRSLDYEVTQSGENISFEFLMDDYGEFVDQGVSGTKKKYNTPYSYKSKMPPKKDILRWVKQKRLRFRDDKGRFIRGNQNSLAFLIQRSIFEKGIKPSLFFTRPFDKAFPLLAPALEEAYAKDIEDSLDNLD